MRLERRQEEFINYLLGLAKEGQRDSGALAELRSGLGKKPGEMSRVHRHVVPFLTEGKYWQDRWYYLVATLFGLHPMHKDSNVIEADGRIRREDYTVGTSFGEVWMERGHVESIEARFIALINADPDDLDDHLRHAISLLKAHEKPLDWRRLFSDILNWGNQDKEVQRKWARDFYKQSPANKVSSEEKENGDES